VSPSNPDKRRGVRHGVHACSSHLPSRCWPPRASRLQPSRCGGSSPCSGCNSTHARVAERGSGTSASVVEATCRSQNHLTRIDLMVDALLDSDTVATPSLSKGPRSEPPRSNSYPLRRRPGAAFLTLHKRNGQRPTTRQGRDERPPEHRHPRHDTAPSDCPPPTPVRSAVGRHHDGAPRGRAPLGARPQPPHPSVSEQDSLIRSLGHF
jgi:hypothetical protein